MGVFKTNIGTYRRIPSDPGARKAAVISAVVCILLVFGGILGLKLLPHYSIYKPFYNGAIIYIFLFAASIFILSLGIIILVINKKTPIVKGIFGYSIFAIVFINVILLYQSNTNPIDWLSDLKYALNNDPPSTVNVLSVKRYQVTHSTRTGISADSKADIKVGAFLFTADDEGTIQQFLNTHKAGATVKAYYMPKTNILIFLESSEESKNQPQL